MEKYSKESLSFQVRFLNTWNPASIQDLVLVLEKLSFKSNFMAFLCGGEIQAGQRGRKFARFQKIFNFNFFDGISVDQLGKDSIARGAMV